MALTDNLISVWHMNNNWQDSWGTNHGTAYGAIFDATVKKLGSHAGSFDGVDDYTYVPASASLNIGSGDFSIQAWINISQAGTEKDIVIMDDNNDVIRLYITTGNLVKFTARDSGGDVATASSTTTISIDTWYHIVGVREGTTVRIYVNGVLENSATNAALGNVITTDHWHIGVGVNGTDTHARWFKGRLDEVAVAGRVWQQADVTESYNGGAGIELGAILQRLHERTSRGVNRGLGRGMR